MTSKTHAFWAVECHPKVIRETPHNPTIIPEYGRRCLQLDVQQGSEITQGQITSCTSLISDSFQFLSRHRRKIRLKVVIKGPYP
jgi:hypothetical protein